MKEAYDSAVTDALYMEGHGGYTGSIAESGGWKELSLRPQGITGVEADFLVEDAEKWGPTLISPVIDETTLSKVLKTTKIKWEEGDRWDNRWVLEVLKFIKENANTLAVVEARYFGDGETYDDKNTIVISTRKILKGTKKLRDTYWGMGIYSS